MYVSDEVRMCGSEGGREQWKFLLEVFSLPWATLLKVKVHKFKDWSASSELAFLSVKAGPTHLQPSMSL